VLTVSHIPVHLRSSGYGPCPTPALTPWDPLRHYGHMALEVCLGALPALALVQLALQRCDDAHKEPSF
jgi:hypothetical protein